MVGSGWGLGKEIAMQKTRMGGNILCSALAKVLLHGSGRGLSCILFAMMFRFSDFTYFLFSLQATVGLPAVLKVRQ